MSHTLKSLFVVALAIAFIGCNKHKSSKTSQSSQQQQPQIGQGQQSPPDVNVSDKEADKFADAELNAQKVQMKAQKKMVGAIKDQGLDIKTYQKIAAQSSQGGKATGKVSSKKMKKYQKAQDNIKEIQKNTQKEIADAVNDAGMKMQRFQAINQAAQQDTALRKKLMQKIQKKMGNNGAMQQQAPPH
jgi:hypothetical protein